MEPKFQNSFIPKRPITSSRGSGVPRRKQQVSFFSVIVSLAFILVLAAAGGLFGYTKYISSEISKKDALLQEAIGAVDKEEVKELSVVDTQLRSATTLLRHHLVPTYFFDFLEEIVKHLALQFPDIQDCLHHIALKSLHNKLLDKNKSNHPLYI